MILNTLLIIIINFALLKKNYNTTNHIIYYAYTITLHVNLLLLLMNYIYIVSSVCLSLLMSSKFRHVSGQISFKWTLW